MANAKATLSNAYNQTTWTSKVGGTTFYIKKLRSLPSQTFRIWNSGDPTTYVIDLNDAVAYFNANGPFTVLEAGKAPPVPVKPTPKNNPKPNNLKGAADGDNSGGQPAAKKPVAGKASAAKTAGSKSAIVDEPPGRRLKNPLAYMASYNYQLSLYMITPDAYDAFIKSDYRDIYVFNNAAGGIQGAGGAFLIAQSGGVNNDSDVRSPWFNSDLGIDNLRFTHAYPVTSESSTASAEYSVSFDIFEPYGFSFLSNMKRANDAIAEYSKNLSNELTAADSPLRQHFIIGIRFYGYDDSGNLLTGDEIVEATTLDPNAGGTGDSKGLFSKYLDITLKTVKFTLDGKSTKYACEAEVISQAAQGSKRGILATDFNPTATTVGDALDQLAKQLTSDSAANSKNSKQPTTYSITYSTGSEDIRNASLVSPADLDKLKWPGSGAKTTDQVNDKTATTGGTASNTARQFQFRKDDPVLTVITSVITQSQYLEAALKTLYTTAVETDKKGIEEQSKSNPVDVAWFSCVPKLSNARWDQDKADWNYDIEYQIKSYRTPIVKSSYVKSGGKIYSPLKRYDYWYSGKNSEIIEYRQEFNNAYYEIVVRDGSEIKSGTESSPTNESSVTPKQTGQRQDQPRLGRPNLGLEAQNSYLTSLYSPANQIEANITIYGDPDLIGIGRASTENAIYQKFYSPDGFSVNADGGQVFIEINFNEATDYNEATGTLNINSSVVLWKNYPPELNIKGVSYRVLKTISTFSGGVFKQLLNCAVNMPTNFDVDANARALGKETAPSTPGATPGNSNSTTTGTGLKTDPAPPKTSPPTITPVSSPTGVTTSPTSQLPQTITVGSDPVTVNGAPDINATAGGFNLSNVGNSSVDLTTITSGIIPQNTPVADDDSVIVTGNSTSFNDVGRISTPFQINTNLT